MKNKTILALGNDGGINDVISKQLDSAGYRTITTTKASEINSLSEEFRPELIIYNVDDKQGLDTLIYKNAKKETLTANLPVIFLVSGIDIIENITHLDNDAEDFLQKPVDSNLLLAKVKTFFKKSAKTKHFYEQRMEKLRDNISFALPHEFRTSLNGILGFSEMILKMTYGKKFLDTKDIEDIRDMACTIRDSGNHLNRLTENFLLYTQIQTMEGKPDKLEELRSHFLHNSKDIITDVANSLFEHARRMHDLKLIVKNACLNMSPYYFYKLIYELVDNAIKFSTHGSPVEINTGRYKDRYCIILKDHGIGMTSEQIYSIGAYRQFDRYINEQQGAGLGLIIAKLIVILHGGVFSIKSDLGIGTTIMISLPIQDEKHESWKIDAEYSTNSLTLA